MRPKQLGGVLNTMAISGRVQKSINSVARMCDGCTADLPQVAELLVNRLTYDWRMAVKNQRQRVLANYIAFGLLNREDMRGSRTFELGGHFAQYLSDKQRCVSFKKGELARK